MNEKPQKKSALSEAEKLQMIEDSIKVPFPKDGCWEVSAMIPFEEAYNEILPKILRLVKDKISKKYNLPVGLLSYQSIKEKDIESGGIRLTARVMQSEPERGEPVLRFLSV